MRSLGNSQYLDHLHDEGMPVRMTRSSATLDHLKHYNQWTSADNDSEPKLKGTKHYRAKELNQLHHSVFFSTRKALALTAVITEMVGLSIGEKHFIQGGIAQDLRSDGRKRLTIRPIYVETGVISQANGSARVRMGATDVIACVKAELGRPNALQPDKGKVIVNVDCSPTAAPMFEGRGGEELSAELSVALQRCLLGGKSGSGAGIDLSSLVVVEGKICWDLYIDGLVVSSDGNLLDALGAAIKYYVAKEKSSGMTYLLKKLMFPKAALSNTGIPKVNVAAGASGDEQPEVDVGRHYIVDATSEEESQMCLAVSISMNRQGHICGLTKRGGAGLDPSIILDMISVAKTVSEQLINTLDSHIAAAEAGEEES
ncbi:3'-5'-exoribonuclease family protein [Prunus dulcis]|uniref:Ribosomal RNA-processing protein 42 n=1 Tax=Prunus dulcis TaxID=3755 RepID=A0A4Y1RSD8_PRUDU|nr:3'-5'-exoribonuclease family protein [Prunus dulcis]